jgi:hypothetical protein
VIRLFVAMLVGLILVVALATAASVARGADAGPNWEMRHPMETRHTGAFRDSRLKESSGVAASRRQPGILWTHNDSGDGAWLFATDTLGTDLGAFRVQGAENRDWEAIALGPCEPNECLYIADAGDNAENHREVRIYRVPEPILPSRSQSTRPADVLELRYPDGASDVEAAFVARDGAIFLVTKGRHGPAKAYRVPASAWRMRGTVVAEALGALPFETGGLANYVTDAALSPAGDRVAVRTYLALFLFELTERNRLIPTGLACDTGGLQLQGEGVSWLNDRELVLTSEGGFGARGSIVLLACGS